MRANSAINNEPAWEVEDAFDSGPRRSVDQLNEFFHGPQFARALEEIPVAVDHMTHEWLGELAEGIYSDVLPGLSFDLIKCLLANGARVDSWSTFYEGPGPYEPGYDYGIPIAAQPLYRAARGGRTEVIQLFLQHSADPVVAATDGSTPLFKACDRGHLEVVLLLCSLGVSMMIPDQAGKIPILAAAASGQLEILKSLQSHGADLLAPGHFLIDMYDDEPEFVRVKVCRKDGADLTWDYNWSNLRKNVTALTIARDFEHLAIVNFLEGVATAANRPRSEVPMHERAADSGISQRLKSIPTSLIEATKTGTQEERKAAKSELRKRQKHNQQIVAREEQKQLKQQKLSLPC